MEKSTVSLDFKCQKKWDTMTPHDDGRFCHDCKMTVADFSKTSIDKFQTAIPGGSGQKICGNFYAYQLDSPFNSWKDEIISLYQKIILNTSINKISRQLTLFLLMVLLVATGCHRKLRGKIKFADNNNNKQKHQTTQIIEEKK